MTIRELLFAAGRQPAWAQAAVLAIPPFFTIFCSLFHEEGDGNEWPWKYLYSTIIFSIFLPGIFSMVIMGYSVLVVYENLLDANVFLLFGPPASMFLTVQVMKWNAVDIRMLPGFKSLVGLTLMIGSASVAALVIFKARVIVFLSSGDVFKIFLLLFAVMYAGYYLVFLSEDEDEPGEDFV